MFYLWKLLIKNRIFEFLIWLLFCIIYEIIWEYKLLPESDLYIYDDTKALIFGYVYLNIWGIFICSIMQIIFQKPILKFTYGILPAISILLIFGFVTHFSDNAKSAIFLIYLFVSITIWGLNLRSELRQPL
jgi:hypothetical protein